jgi:hypothetical protein
VITSHRPLRPGETVDVAVRVSTPRPHAKGTVVDFIAEVHVGLVRQASKKSCQPEDSLPGL